MVSTLSPRREVVSDVARNWRLEMLSLADFLGSDHTRLDTFDSFF
jgi:hypothetical protein